MFDKANLNKLSKTGIWGIFALDMMLVVALAKIFKDWQGDDQIVFKWAILALFIISVLIVPFIYLACKYIDRRINPLG